MNCKQINEIPFKKLLSRLGYSPMKTTSIEQWYISPFREEKTASFKINIANNTFYDFGEGVGGTVVDFWCKLKNCNVKITIEQITGLFSFPEQNNFLLTKNMKTMKKQKYKPQIEVIEAKPISNPVLIEYLVSRELTSNIYSYIREVHFELNGKKNYAIGFQNDSGGFELRNKLLKACTCKDVTTILKDDSTILTVFEGFMDFLSYINAYAYSEHDIIRKIHEDDNESFLILNSISLKNRAFSYFQRFEEIRLFLDNDEVGKRLTKEILSNYKQAENCSSEYQGFKDFNDFHIYNTRDTRRIQALIPNLKKETNP